MMQVEGIVLTGGASRRMGEDKASLLVDGEPLGARVAREISRFAAPVTVLGQFPIEGYEFKPDSELHRGPLNALAAYRPSTKAVFVASCDLPLFDGRLIPVLVQLMGRADAAVPFVDGFRQPLCALYRASAFGILAELMRTPDVCPMDWLNALSVRNVPGEELAQHRVSPDVTRGANTREELSRLLGE